MGSPGAGKTTVGRMVAQAVGKTPIDVDNDHLEKVWGMTVAQKVSINEAGNRVTSRQHAFAGPHLSCFSLQNT